VGFAPEGVKIKKSGTTEAAGFRLLQKCEDEGFFYTLSQKVLKQRAGYSCFAKSGAPF